jgi:hypothetical protein
MSFITNFVDKVKCYKRVFKKDNPDVKAILADLGRFAPVDPTSKCVKPYRDNEVFMMIGRRQVVNYILGKIKMTDSELSDLVKEEQLKQQQSVKM